MLDFEWILNIFGLVVIVCLSKIGAPIRGLAYKIHSKFGEMLSCPMCFGFWAGIGFSLLGYSHFGGYDWYSIIFDGLLASSTAHILYCITWRLALHDNRF